jgi:hypothetical protein
MNINESSLKNQFLHQTTKKNLTYASGIYSVLSKYLRRKCSCANEEQQTVGNKLTGDIAEEERK